VVRKSRRLYYAIAIAASVMALGLVWRRCTYDPLRSLCGDRYEEARERELIRGGCTVKGDQDERSIRIEWKDDRIAQLTLRVSRYDDDEAAIRDVALELADPFLDGDELAAVARALATLQPAGGKARTEVVDDVTIRGATYLWNNAPDRRWAGVEVACRMRSRSSKRGVATTPR
jgi:hypothetical protein